VLASPPRNPLREGGGMGGLTKKPGPGGFGTDPDFQALLKKSAPIGPARWKRVFGNYLASG